MRSAAAHYTLFWKRINWQMQVMRINFNISLSLVAILSQAYIYSVLQIQITKLKTCFWSCIRIVHQMRPLDLENTIRIKFEQRFKEAKVGSPHCRSTFMSDWRKNVFSRIIVKLDEFKWFDLWLKRLVNQVTLNAQSRVRWDTWCPLSGVQCSVSRSINLSSLFENCFPNHHRSIGSTTISTSQSSFLVWKMTNINLVFYFPY